MSFDPNQSTVARARVDTAEIDVGLRKYMLRVYNYMALGVAFTGVVALLVASSPQALALIYGTPLKWGLILGIIGMGWFGPRMIMTGSVATAHAMFWVKASMWGALAAPYFLVYTGESMVRVFFITTAAFAGLSLYGYTTKRNLGPIGAFLCMATIGLLIALFVNVFIFQSEMMHTLLSIVVVLVFAGLTAYDTQNIKGMYYESDGAEVVTRKAIFGAFHLYSSFIIMFLYLVQLFGVARE